MFVQEDALKRARKKGLVIDNIDKLEKKVDVLQDGKKVKVSWSLCGNNLML